MIHKNEMTEMGYTEEYVVTEFAARIRKILHDDCSCITAYRIDYSSNSRVWRVQEYSRMSGTIVQDYVAVGFENSLQFYRL